MDNITIYHGSEKTIVLPKYGQGKPYNDYGLGFYCTEDKALAQEWAVLENRDGFANEYTLNMDGLKTLNLSDKQYSVLHWLTILLKNRVFRLKGDIAVQGRQYLMEKYSIDVSSFDIIKGYRADDSYFSYAQSFLNNELSVSRLEAAMKYGKLGEQIVLVSQKAFEQIDFVSAVRADSKVFWPKRFERNEQARLEYLKTKSRAITKDDVFLADLIRYND